MTADLSVSQVAARLQIRRESVKRLIESGWLEGYDASPPGAKRKAYRVTELSLSAYRQSRKVTKSVATRRSKLQQPVKEFV